MVKLLYALLVLTLVVWYKEGLPVHSSSHQLTSQLDYLNRNMEPVTLDGTLRRISVPILMYHYVSVLPPDADAYRIDLTVEPSMFQAHMKHLFDNGYQTISLYDLHEALSNGRSLPLKPVILTFDDGYVDHYTTVFPQLNLLGFTGTFFVITSKADTNASGYMSWLQIKEMAEAGMAIESHSKTHLDLRGRSYDALVYELLGSMESITAHIDRETHIFSYPSGRYDNDTLKVLETLPIWRAVTTQHGMLHTTDNVFELPRIRVAGGINVEGLEYLLRG